MTAWRCGIHVLGVLTAGCVAGQAGITPAVDGALEADDGGVAPSDELVWEDEELWAEEEASGFWEAGWEEEPSGSEELAESAEGDVGAAAEALGGRRGRAAVPRYGAHFPYLWRDTHERYQTDLEQLRGAGVRYVRVIFPVRDDAPFTEVRQEAQDTIDPVVLRAARAGLVVLPILIRGRIDENGALNDFEQYVQWAAERYGVIQTAQQSACPGRELLGSFWREHCELEGPRQVKPIRVWEVWNEPNLAPHYWVEPARFAEVLRRAHQALRVVHPYNRVVFGGLSSTGQLSPRAYLEQVTMAPGAKQLFDAVGLHPYADTVEDAVEQVRQLHNKLRDLGLHRGDRDDVSIWITEMGWAVPSGEYTCTNRRRDGRCGRSYTIATERWQQRYMAAFARRMREHERDWRVGPMFWYSFRDYTAAKLDRSVHDWDLDCGLVSDAIDPMSGLRVVRSLDRYGRIADERASRWVRPPPRRR